MARLVAFLYGLVAYAVFFVTFLYAIGFVEGLLVPKAIDDGVVVPASEALIVNLVLMALFAIQHSVMARPWFKQWWTAIVPASVERSTYVLFSSLALIRCSGNGGRCRRWCGRSPTRQLPCCSPAFRSSAG
jgi:methanethiol S-methyltransferase